jgi:hypothetical protein
MIITRSEVQGQSPELTLGGISPQINAIAATAHQETVTESGPPLSPQADIMNESEASTQTDTYIREETVGTEQRPRDG